MSLDHVIGLEGIVLFELIPQFCLRVNAKFLMHSDFKHVDILPLDPEINTDKEPFRKVNIILFQNKLIKLSQHELKGIRVPQKGRVQVRLAFKFGLIDFVFSEEPEFTDTELVNVNPFGVVGLVSEEEEVVFVGEKMERLVFRWFLFEVFVGHSAKVQFNSNT